ncbi:hypothetical protein OR214_03872 [Ralstonia pickettii OR214]|uniref:Uncharacterized protein n=1 Tax=Ralstonia pickettii OR214 TaxID=1264675 RepID=R0DR87_RALPI|nr:hypothetical protein OR214_03872 [Ralstonia pickettii OR214]
MTVCDSRLYYAAFLKHGRPVQGLELPQPLFTPRCPTVGITQTRLDTGCATRRRPLRTTRNSPTAGRRPHSNHDLKIFAREKSVFSIRSIDKSIFQIRISNFNWKRKRTFKQFENSSSPHPPPPVRGVATRTGHTQICRPPLNAKPMQFAHPTRHIGDRMQSCPIARPRFHHSAMPQRTGCLIRLQVRCFSSTPHRHLKNHSCVFTRKIVDPPAVTARTFRERIERGHLDNPRLSSHAGIADSQGCQLRRARRCA